MNTHVLSSLDSAALIALMLEQGINLGSLDIHHRGAFRKKSNGSVQHLLVEDDTYCLKLNECSIYDKLPEGLFHQPRTGQRQQSQQYIEEHKRYKKEEELARKFFSPFDQFMLLAKTEAYQWKATQLSAEDVYHNALIVDEYDLQGFQDPKFLPYLLVLLKQRELLAGRGTLLAKAIGSLLECTVDFNFGHIPLFELDKVEEDTIYLGWNSALGGVTSEYICEWIFKFKFHDFQQMSLLLNDQMFHEFLKICVHIFIPIDVTVGFEWAFRQQESVILEQCLLGVSTI